MKIIKRDGRIVDYDKEKIVIAIEKANNEVRDEDKIARKDIDNIIDYIEKLDKKRMLVEDIQDIIEEKLMDKKKFNLAKKYIIYRYTRSLIRKTNTTDSSLLALLKNKNASSDEYLVANKQRETMAGEVSKDLAYRILLPKNVTEYEKENLIKFCNVEYFTEPIIESSYVNIKKMLENGIVLNGIKIEKPKNFQSACNVIVEVIASLLSLQTGELYIDFSDLFEYYYLSLNKRINLYLSIMGDSITKDEIISLAKNRTFDEVRSGLQTIFYELNTITLSNAAIPRINFLVDTDEIMDPIEEHIIFEFIKQKNQGIVDENNNKILTEYPKIIYKITKQYDYILDELVNGNSSFIILNENSYLNFKSHIKKFKQGTIAINIYAIAQKYKSNFLEKLKETLEVVFEGFLCINHNLRGVQAGKSPVHWQYKGISSLTKDEVIDKYLKSTYSYLELSVLGFESALKILKDDAIKNDVIKIIDDYIKNWNKINTFAIVTSNICNKYDMEQLLKRDKELYSKTSIDTYIDNEKFMEESYYKCDFMFNKFISLNTIKDNYIYLNKKEED